jgi:tetratricopeptide (TPR) repeat protein
MNPGYDTAHPDPRRKIGYDCMFCHNGYPSIPAGHEEIGAEPKFIGAMPEGIDCQRCHGPGGAHVRAAQVAKPDAAEVRKAIVNPARLSNDRKLEVCMQCHLETTSTRLPNSIRKFDRGPFSYRPGEPLSSFMLFFDHAAGTGRDEKFEIVSSAYRLRKSQCFLKSNGALQCITCHNPHDIPRGAAAVKHYNGVCRQCHATSHAPTPNCISCHMPKRRTDDVVHAVITDHLIQRRKPEWQAALETAYHGEVVPYYPAKPAAEDALYVAAVQVNQQSNLKEGIAKFPPPNRMEFFIVLGDALKAAGETGKAIANYEEAVRLKPGSALALRRLGVAKRDAAVLLRAAEAAPDSGEIQYEIGVLASAQSRNADAVQAFETAVTLDPGLPDAYDRLGVALAGMDQPARAEGAFREALKIDPRSAEANGDLGLLLFRMNRFDEAQQHLAEAVRLGKGMAEFHQLLGNLYERKGQIGSALGEYREALRIRPGFLRPHLDIGAIYAAQGHKAAAIEEFKRAAQSTDAEVRQMASEALRQLQ